MINEDRDKQTLNKAAVKELHLTECKTGQVLLHPAILLIAMHTHSHINSTCTVQLTFHIAEQNITFFSLSPSNNGSQDMRKRDILKREKAVLGIYCHHDPGLYEFIMLRLCTINEFICIVY